MQVLNILFQYIGSKSEDGGGLAARPDHFCLVEKWRKIERPLGQSSKVLRVWQAWGEDKSEVRLVVKRSGPGQEAKRTGASGGQHQQPGASASEGAEAGIGDTPSREVRRRRSRMVRKLDTVHPK